MITLRLNQQPPCLAVYELRAIQSLLSSSLVDNGSLPPEVLDHIYSASLSVGEAILKLSGVSDGGVH